MKQRYRVFLRGWGTLYCEDLVTRKQETLKTRVKNEAFRLVIAKNESEETGLSPSNYRRQRRDGSFEQYCDRLSKIATTAE